MNFPKLHITPHFLLMFLLAACGTQPNQSNNYSGKDGNAPRQASPHEEGSYMKIIGNLRWDKLTSNEEWAARFPECVSRISAKFISKQVNEIKKNKERYSSDASYLEDLAAASKQELQIRYIEKPLTNWGSNDVVREPTPNCKYDVGGIIARFHEVLITENPSTASKNMTEYIALKIPNVSQRRAFMAAVIEKYEPILVERKSQAPDLRYCSKYTCFKEDSDTIIYLYPADYTVSLLDAVKINSNAL